MRKGFCLLALLLLTVGAQADGCWLMRVGGRNFLTVDIHGNVATLVRPRHFSLVHQAFRGITAETTRENLLVRARDGQLELVSAQGQSPLAIDPRVPQLVFMAEGKPFLACPLLSVETAPPLQADWPQDRALYADLAEVADNPEMGRLYEEDQAVRSQKDIDWKVAAEQDKVRRERVRVLLAEDKVLSGTDFRQAAFIFQHGGTPQDYLLAHTLATLAVLRGDREAAWIASATLDRYLQSVGQAQIYGTQYRRDESGWTQQPMDTGLVSDELRTKLGVPRRADQEAQLEKYRSQR